METAFSEIPTTIVSHENSDMVSNQSMKNHVNSMVLTDFKNHSLSMQRIERANTQGP